MSEVKLTLRTTSEAKKKLAAVALAGLEFLDVHGRPGAKDSRIANARLTFIDGDALVMARSEFDRLTDEDFGGSNHANQGAHV